MSENKHNTSSKDQAEKFDLNESIQAFQEVSAQERKNREQTHGHNKFWVDFLTDRILLVVLLVLGTVSVYKTEDPILRTGYVSLFSGTAGALIHKLRQPAQRTEHQDRAG